MPVASLRLCTSFWSSRPVALMLVEHSATATPAQYAPTSPELNTLPMRLLVEVPRSYRQGGFKASGFGNSSRYTQNRELALLFS